MRYLLIELNRDGMPSVMGGDICTKADIEDLAEFEDYLIVDMAKRTVYDKESKTWKKIKKRYEDSNEINYGELEESEEDTKNLKS